MKSDTPSSFEVLQAYLTARATFSAEDLAFMQTVYIPRRLAAGDFLGMPPSGKTVRSSAMQMFRFSQGKIVESWVARDDLGTLRQLGHVALPGRPAER